MIWPTDSGLDKAA